MSDAVGARERAREALARRRAERKAREVEEERLVKAFVTAGEGVERARAALDAAEDAQAAPVRELRALGVTVEEVAEMTGLPAAEVRRLGRAVKRADKRTVEVTPAETATPDAGDAIATVATEVPE